MVTSQFIILGFEMKLLMNKEEKRELCFSDYHDTEMMITMTVRWQNDDDGDKYDECLGSQDRSDHDIDMCWSSYWKFILIML